MAEQQTATCPECSRTISPEDTIVFRFGILGHLDCRRPRVLSAEERTLLFIYCRDHQVAECVRCSGRFHLREVASLDSFASGIPGSASTASCVRRSGGEGPLEADDDPPVLRARDPGDTGYIDRVTAARQAKR
jgi:hypothetical protein